MKIYTNKNNTSTLKLLIAAKLAGKNVDLIDATFDDDIFAGPRSLPILVVDDNLSFFTSNAAAQYLFPIVDTSGNGQCQQLLELEATRLHPAVHAVISSKSVPSDLKQALQAVLQTLNAMLEKNQYLLGNQISSADISVWSTLYPLLYNTEHKQAYISQCTQIIKWSDHIAAAGAIQEAIKQWGGSATGPFAATSVLGVPQLPSITSPVTTPDEEAVVGPSIEEIESAKDSWLNGLTQLLPPHKQDKLVLPVKGRKNVLITSALPYVNNVPHLGNIIGCVLSADIFARYCRLCDYNTLYISGTDEYGTATETKALEEGVTPREICDKYFEIHNNVYRWFNIGFDYFGRTSTPHQTQISQKMFLKLRENGFVNSQSVDQLLCQNCDRFLADRFVEGTCPHPGCLYESARGDQCDKCGKLINAVELIHPKCKVCGHTPTVRPSEQLFIELGQLEPSIRTWIGANEGAWSAPARAVTRAWLKEPLRARAVTRDLKWGVPVPVEGFQNKVFYVWFDAPIGYMSITEAATKQYEKWWKADKEYDVKLYQFMAKDNVPFHVIMFPATLIGVNEGHTLVSHVFATEYLNYEDGKFSKSRGVGVFGNDAQDTGIPSDVWRFYLASIRPETSDSSFSWTELATRNNSELLNNLGNFCHRSLSFCWNSFKGKVPDLNLAPADYELLALVNREVVAYVQHMEKGRLRESLRHVMSISRIGNQHMQAQQPWVLLKGSDDDKRRGSTAIGVCCQLVALLCTLIAPYMPDTSSKLRGQLNLYTAALRINPLKPSFHQYLPSGHTINRPEPLFVKIEPELVESLRTKYAGTQADRNDKTKQNGVAAPSTSGQSVADIEAAIMAQGNKVRELKASTKDKTVWQPEVKKLLDMKKQLEAAIAAQPAQHSKDCPLAKQPASAPAPAAASADGDTIEGLVKAITVQGDIVRKLKAATKDKSVWQPEVAKLLDFKKRLAVLHGEQ